MSDVAAPEVADLDDEFTTVTATLKGTKYVFREMDVKTYNKLTKMATINEDGDIDNELLMRLMVQESMREPKLSIAQVEAKPLSVSRRFNAIVNQIHFTIVESDEEKAEREAKAATESDDDKGEVSGGPTPT